MNFKRGVAAALISSAILSAAARAASEPPPLPKLSEQVFKITDHGATAGGDFDNAKAIQETIKAAAAAGGGVVEVPAGDFLCGPITLADGIDLRLDTGATLRMPTIDKYPGGTQNPQSFITGRGLHDIAITGEGTIEGQGSGWWPLVKKQQIGRPRMIALSGCDRILIEHVHLQNSPMFHIAISGHSTNVTVRGVTIRAPASTDPVNPSHNTDACDVSGSHVLIEDCDVSVGDDNFTCGGGTSDVHIIHCKYGTGHGVSIGSPISGGVSDLTVEDCTFDGTEAGIRIKSDRDRGGVVQRCVYRNLTMTNVQFPILIYGAYNAQDKKYRDLANITAETATGYPAQPMGAKTPVYKDITFSNITATTGKGHRAGLIWGLPEAPANNIHLQNVTITADKPFGIFNATGITMEGCKFVMPDGAVGLVTGNAGIAGVATRP